MFDGVILSRENKYDLGRWTPEPASGGTSDTSELLSQGSQPITHVARGAMTLLSGTSCAWMSSDMALGSPGLVVSALEAWLTCFPDPWQVGGWKKDF